MATEKSKASFVDRLREIGESFKKGMTELYAADDKLKDQTGLADLLLRKARLQAGVDYQMSVFDNSIKEVLDQEGLRSMFEKGAQLAKAVQDFKDKGYELDMGLTPSLVSLFEALESHKSGPFHDLYVELAPFIKDLKH